MTRTQKYVNSIVFACLIVLLIFMPGCDGQTINITPSALPTSTLLPPTAIPPTPTTIPRPPLSAEDVKALAAEFDKLASTDAEAWDEGNIELMRQFYASDITIHEAHQNFMDVSNPIDHYVDGVDIVISILMDFPIQYHPNLEARLADTFIGRESGIVVLDMVGYIDIPTTAYYLYILRGGKIAEFWPYWNSVAAAVDGWLIPEKLLPDYATAWSSGDPEAVVNLYTPYVVRQDTLFGYDQQRSTAVKEFAADFFAWYPGVRLELLDSLLWSVKDIGGVYSIHVSDQAGKPCDVRAIILIELLRDKIKNERVLYNADSLIACGWAQ